MSRMTPKTVRAAWMPAGVLALLGALASAQEKPAVPATLAEVPGVTVAELKALLAKGEAVVVDVRPRDVYALGHIEGAVHVSPARLSVRMKDLPRDKHIVAYCTCHEDSTAIRVARELLGEGYPKASYLKDGLEAWQAAGGKVVTGP
jgi:rhodanese-related sulfurtransferase